MKKHTDLGVQEDFFAKPTEASRRKLQIVSEYFDAYMRVLARNKEARYADLFAGPGRYDNGDRSVPLVICEKVAGDKHLQKFAKLWFNEGDSELAAKLERNIRAVEGIAKVQYQITNKVISNALASRFERASAPTFIFADPCRYKGLSLRLVTSVLKGFGNDCLFFFNYNRVNMKLGCPVMDQSIDEFFEHDRATALRAEVGKLHPPAREKMVLGAIKLCSKRAPCL